MKIPHSVVVATSGAIIPTAFAFLQEAILVMVPWMITMFFIILTDLAAGLWKSYKLGIEIRVSKGCRETMGKLLVYFAFVCMVACLNVVYADNFQFAKWAAGIVVALELGSIVGNLLKPHGINLSLNAILKAVLAKSPLPLTCENIDDIVVEKPIEEIIKEEKEKIEKDEQMHPKKPGKPKKTEK